MPVAILARPLPSTLTERAICVSVVLRSAVAERGGIAVSFSAIAYTKSALGERFRERGKTSLILLRRPDGESAMSCRVRGSARSEEHTSELQSRQYLVCRLLLEKKKKET